MLLAVPPFDLVADNPEGDRRFGGRPRFRDDDRCDVVIFGRLHQLPRVVLADVLPGEEHTRIHPFLRSREAVERAAQRLQHRLGPQIGAPDPDRDDQVGFVPQHIRCLLNLIELRRGDRRRQVHPAQKVVPLSLAAVQQSVALFDLRPQGGDVRCGHRRGRFENLVDAYVYTFHSLCVI